jgi:hypothetical protein
MTTFPTVRVVRPTDDIEALLPFYREGLGLDVLYRFADHDGFNGVMIGRAGAPYHFEFTKALGHCAGRAPTQDNLTIFYLPDVAEWQATVDRMEDGGSRRLHPSILTGISLAGPTKTLTDIGSSFKRRVEHLMTLGFGPQ